MISDRWCSFTSEISGCCCFSPSLAPVSTFAVRRCSVWCTSSRAIRRKRRRGWRWATRNETAEPQWWWRDPENVWKMWGISKTYIYILLYIDMDSRRTCGTCLESISKQIHCLCHPGRTCVELSGIYIIFLTWQNVFDLIVPRTKGII